MHIEPEVVEGSKLLLSYGSAAASIAWGMTYIKSAVKLEGIIPFVVRAFLATTLVFVFFEVFPTYAVGVSEVHLILGTSLLLLFGVGPAAIGLLSGLLVQGLLFAPSDLPQYAMNITTLLVPLFATHTISRRIIPAHTAYVDINYSQVFKLSLAYQGGIVAWVCFWAVYGNGLGAENLASIGTFGLAYMSVVLIEPLFDLAVLAGAKSLRKHKTSAFFHKRLHRAETATQR